MTTLNTLNTTLNARALTVHQVSLRPPSTHTPSIGRVRSTPVESASVVGVRTPGSLRVGQRGVGYQPTVRGVVSGLSSERSRPRTREIRFGCSACGRVDVGMGRTSRVTGSGSPVYVGTPVPNGRACSVSVVAACQRSDLPGEHGTRYRTGVRASVRRARVPDDRRGGTRRVPALYRTTPSNEAVSTPDSRRRTHRNNVDHARRVGCHVSDGHRETQQRLSSRPARPFHPRNQVRTGCAGVTARLARLTRRAT